MKTLVLGREEYRDKVFACWLGKNIGGTLGAPHEAKRYALGLEFYEPLPKKAAPNDDLDLQLVWLQMLEEQGVDPALPCFSEYWVKYAASYPWNEYGFFMRNTERGLMPPIAGCFENYYVDEMGSPIRSEIWACLHPGDPQAAARMAWKDSAVDHTGGEGTWGEMFWAGLQAAAFVEKAPRRRIRIGRAMSPVSSHGGRALREASWCWENKKTWGDARERIASRFGWIQPCNAVVNHGFTIMGWLYGRDFGDQLLKTVNCGYDTDCTGATLGATLGIIHGTKGIPEKWVKPVGTKIVLCKFTRGLDAPKSIAELTRRTVKVAEKAMKASTERTFGKTTVKPTDLMSRLMRNEIAESARMQDIHAGAVMCGEREVRFHYGGEPVLRPGEAKVVRVSMVGEEVGRVELKLPKGWTCERMGDAQFRLYSAGTVADRNRVEVILGKGKRAAFTMLGPGEAKGFAAGVNVETCPVCRARVAACICEKKKRKKR